MGGRTSQIQFTTRRYKPTGATDRESTQNARDTFDNPPSNGSIIIANNAREAYT